MSIFVSRRPPPHISRVKSARTRGSYPMSTEKIDLGRLFELYADDVRRALRRYGGSRMPVEDGLQEVFEIALRDYHPARPARPWLLKTAFHVAQNWRRMAQH